MKKIMARLNVDFPKLKRAALVFLAILLPMVLVAGISAGVFQYLKPSSEEMRAEVIKIIKDGGLIEVLSDGQYDETYLLAELKGSSLESLTSFVRPIEISIVDKEENVLAQITGTGMLVDRYVLTSPTLFSFLGASEVQEALISGEIEIGIKLCADFKQDDEWKFELLQLMGIGNNVAVLQRLEPLVFPTPTELPFRLGRIEDLNLEEREDVLYGIGTLSLEEGKKALHPYQGKVELSRIKEGVIVFSSVLVPPDFGGPIFALRDGEFELVGLVQFGGDGKARAISIQTIFNEIEKAGLEIDIKFKE